MNKEPIMIGVEISNEPQEIFDENEHTRNWRRYRQGPIDKYTFTFSDKDIVVAEIDERQPLKTYHIIVRKIAETFFINKKLWPKAHVVVLLDNVKDW